MKWKTRPLRQMYELGLIAATWYFYGVGPAALVAAMGFDLEWR